MKKEIFIVHPFEIIRRGLNAILRTYFTIEITQLSSMEKMTSFSNLSNAHIILISNKLEHSERFLVQTFKKHNHVDHVEFEDPETEQKKSISLNDTAEDIQKLISDLLRPGMEKNERSGHDEELTLREKEVLQLVALGNSNKEIADKLFISIHTVISHRKNITEKLGIKSISGLTVYAILNKIIDTDSINPENLI